MSLSDIYLTLFLLFVYMAPLAFIASSTKTRDHEKTGWLFAAIFFSWFALVAYWATTPNKRERKARHRDKMQREYLAGEALKKRRLRELKASQAAAAAQPELQEQVQAPLEAPKPDIERSV